MKTVTLTTNVGDIKIQLHEKRTPKTVENFIHYAESGFYDNTIFHRVINNFMIQGGGLTEDLQRKTTNDPIENEASDAGPNKRATVAMARTNDPHSASSQFFINVKDNNFLNYTGDNPQGYGYCVFGEVIEGMDVVDEIKAVETTTIDGFDDVPVTPIIIQQATVEIVEEV